MTSAEQLKSVLEENQKILQRARELNMRAGSEVFPVPPTQMLKDLVRQCLAGARCVSEIRDPECLRLPPLDEAEEAQVLAKAPDTIALLGKDRLVFYQKGATPQVEIPQEEAVAHVWKDLPDEGVYLPDGRRVCVYVHWSTWDAFHDTDLRELKRLLKDRANEAQWLNFREKPVIALPDPMDPGSRIQRVKEVVYGNCVVTGAPLVAYGTLAVQSHGWLSSSFVVQWTRDVNEAYQAHDEAVRRLDAIRTEKAREIENRFRYSEARKVQEELVELSRQYGSDQQIPQNLRDRLNSLAYEIFSELGAERYMNKAAQFKAQLSPVVEAADERRQAEVKAAAIAEARNIELYGVTGHLLDTARALAERALENHKDNAEDIFMEELTAPYGRERRQQAIRGRLGNGGPTSNFYSLSRASDVDAVLEAAIKVVNEKRVSAVAKAATSTQPKTPADPSKFNMGQLFGGAAKPKPQRGNKRKR